jgi:hypothetical protein
MILRHEGSSKHTCTAGHDDIVLDVGLKRRIRNAETSRHATRSRKRRHADQLVAATPWGQNEHNLLPLTQMLHYVISSLHFAPKGFAMVRNNTPPADSPSPSPLIDMTLYCVRTAHKRRSTTRNYLCAVVGSI